MDLSHLLKEIHKLPLDQQRELLELAQDLDKKRMIEKARTKFLPFVNAIWPQFIAGNHHKHMADAFERVADGTCKRLIIAMPPRHTKSEFASWLLPAWFLGRFPHKKIIQASNVAELAMGFGRKVRDTFDESMFRQIFPDAELKADSKAAGRWNTNKRGEYYAVGVNGKVTGRGADLFIVDDPHSEQEAKQAESNPEVFDSVYEWYTSGPRQRLQPGGAIVIVMTRWSKRDLTARVLKKAEETGEEWEVIEFPAILDSGKILWPEFWSEKEILALKNELPVAKWMAQYQQKPTSDTAALIKREYWNVWEKDKLPEFETILQSWDTAFGASERSNYSACTTWGVFNATDQSGVLKPCIMLIDAFKAKMEFPDLKAEAKRLYREWRPEICIIEKKAAGAPLIYELRQAGIPVSEYTPVRGNDKVARVNAVTDIFASGRVYRCRGHDFEEVVEECASFPAGDSDDYVDTVSQALIRFRQGGWIGTDQDDEDDDDTIDLRRRRRAYY